jgi:glutamate-1-semialdehyde aminotransferase/spore coat polysaccharide biosynthesis protein SpsF (cytidylyltransferase family)
MKVHAIIQARCGSTRLPRKVLLKLGARTVLEQVIHQVSFSRSVSKIIVATTTSPDDQPIVDSLAGTKIGIYRGSELDVLERYRECADLFQSDIIVRVTADCPFIDPRLIDLCIEKLISGGYDYFGTITPPSFPDGLDVEVVTREALERAWQSALIPSEREHVTLHIRMHPDRFKIGNYRHDVDLSGIRLTLDEDRDYRALVTLTELAEQRCGKVVHLNDLLDLLRMHPEIQLINGSIVRDEGLSRSLRADGLKNFLDELSRSSMPTIRRSQELFERARAIIPGAAQTFSKGYTQYVQGVCPIYLDHGKGSIVWDVDGNSYVDLVQGLLPNILGYAHQEVNQAVKDQIDAGISFSLPHPLEIELAEDLRRIIPSAEMVRFGKNGSDVTAGAVRLARAYTGREVVACCGYHGWQDWFIGSTARHRGVPEAVRKLTIPFQYNEIESLAKIFTDHPDNVAAVILEPMNFVHPKPGFLEEVKSLAEQHGAVLIFDEICSGWHLGLGGVQKRTGVVPHLSCFGKAMGNGFPIAAVVGRGEIMRLMEEIFFSFTFGGEVASLAAARAVIRVLEREPVTQTMASWGNRVREVVQKNVANQSLEGRVQCLGEPQWWVMKFYDQEGKDSLALRSLFQQEVVKEGVLFLSTHNMNFTFGQSEFVIVERAYQKAFSVLAQAVREDRVEQMLEGSPIQAVFRVR